MGYFLEPLQSLTNPIRSDNLRDPSHTSRPTNINVVPIDYPLRARLRGRLTLLRLALSRNPWDFGERASHPLYRYSCQHSHFRYLHDPLPDRFISLRNAPLPRVLLHTLSFRSEEHTSELQSLMRISYAVFCLKKPKNKQNPSI